MNIMCKAKCACGWVGRLKQRHEMWIYHCPKCASVLLEAWDDAGNLNLVTVGARDPEPAGGEA
jgi:Zn-finger nucleic acid-binding protein